MQERKRSQPKTKLKNITNEVISFDNSGTMKNQVYHFVEKVFDKVKDLEDSNSKLEEDETAYYFFQLIFQYYHCY